MYTPKWVPQLRFKNYPLGCKLQYTFKVYISGVLNYTKGVYREVVWGPDLIARGQNQELGLGLETLAAFPCALAECSQSQ